MKDSGPPAPNCRLTKDLGWRFTFHLSYVRTLIPPIESCNYHIYFIMGADKKKSYSSLH